MPSLGFDSVWTAGGSIAPGWITFDAAGTITSVAGEAPERGEWCGGLALPGMPNLHSHAFQRAFAGHTEQCAEREDSFWTWREAMYRWANRLDPEHVEAITALAQMEMLEAGYTAVGEFHYLHHARDGRPYADPAELAGRVLAAAERTGIAVTLLPVLYVRGGFGRPPLPEQARFVHADAGGFLGLVDAAAGLVGAEPRHRIGVAPHSLRAVPPEDLTVLARVACERGWPLHVHVAEQRREVEECVAALGARPVQWLFDAHDVDARWCLVHATHLDAGERERLAVSPAIAGLCPTTEANLGDGRFAIEEHLARGGRFGVGSDSQATIDPSAELCLLEYGARLRHERRNVAVRGGHTGAALWRAAAAGGAQALDQPCGDVAPGRRADIVVLDPGHPRLIGHAGDTVLDAVVFSRAAGSPVREVFVAGRRVVADGRHVARDAIVADYRRAMEVLHG